MNDDRKLIGFVPVYAPPPGAIVTQAFILCAECGAAVHHNSGPRSGVVCFSCASALLRKVDHERKDEPEISLSQAEKEFDVHVRRIKLLARMQRAKYLALLEAGFDEKQALELAKTL